VPIPDDYVNIYAQAINVCLVLHLNSDQPHEYESWKNKLHNTTQHNTQLFHIDINITLPSKSESPMSWSISIILHTVTYCGFAWLIMMDSGSDDWIYWPFFTITINFDSSHSMTVHNSLQSLLNYECLPFFLIDLVLTHESATSSASVVSWLTLHSWTFN
jgi:hypothetical protein